MLVLLEYRLTVISFSTLDTTGEDFGDPDTILLSGYHYYYIDLKQVQGTRIQQRQGTLLLSQPFRLCIIPLLYYTKLSCIYGYMYLYLDIPSVVIRIRIEPL